MSPTRTHHPCDARTSTGALVLAVSLLTATLVAGCMGLDQPGEDNRDDATGELSSAAGRSGDGAHNASELSGPERDEAPWIGAWLGEWPSDENRAIASFNRRTDDRLDVVDVLVSWNTSYATTKGSLSNIASAGARPLITWSPTGLTTDQLADGSTEIHLGTNETVTLDAYVTSWADGICRFAEHTGQTPLIEPMPEPNGNWHAWSVGYTDANGSSPNTNASYQRAWKHVYETFTSACPDGATFVWTVNGANAGEGSSYLGAFPGENSTDLAGIRGLNLGSYQERGWASFSATAGDAYCNLTQETDLDVVLTGIGSVAEGGDKPAWIDRAVRNASSHAWHRITGIVWYDDELTLDTGAQVHVGVSSSQATLDAYRDAVDRLRNEPIPDGEPPAC